MRSRSYFSARNRWSVLFAALLGLGLTGCHAAHHHSIPANRLPPEWMAKCRNAEVPIDFTLLRQDPPAQYVVGPRDLLGIHIQNVLGGETDAPPFSIPSVGPEVVHPNPVVGHPIEVQADGTINLPLIPPLHVSGMTIAEVFQSIRRAYTVDRNILQPGRDRISVHLIRPRIHRVMVIREDVPADFPVSLDKTNLIVTKHGTGKVLDLPRYENDVLHALIATGGLPGVDARNVVWVLRNQAVDADHWSPAVAQLQQGVPAEQVMPPNGQAHFVKIPLRLPPGELAPFTAQDIILEDGDVVFIESRDTEFFFVGGLLPGSQIALPRDYDLDVLGAVAIANGHVNGPAAGPAANNFRSGPGNIVPPSRVVIVRTLPTGGQIKIDVNIRKALDDPRERIIIQPGDLVLLKYTPLELATNVSLNFFNFNLSGVTSF